MSLFLYVSGSTPVSCHGNISRHSKMALHVMTNFLFESLQSPYLVILPYFKTSIKCSRLAFHEAEILQQLVVRTMPAAYWQAEQEGKSAETQNAIDISMFLICGSPGNINSAVLQTRELQPVFFFPYKVKYFVCYRKQ